MKTDTLKVVRIGNSRGVRLPAPLLARYHIKNQVTAEQRPEGILLRSVKDDTGSPGRRRPEPWRRSRLASLPIWRGT